MRLESIKKQAKFYYILVAVVLAILAVQEAVYYVKPLFSPAETNFLPQQLLLSLPMTLFVVLTLIHSLLMLRSVVREESPFHDKNIRHLQGIGILFVGFELIAWLTQELSNHFFPITFEDGTYMTVSSSYGGVFLVSGLVILVVSDIFRYGVELQKLSDETL